MCSSSFFDQTAIESLRVSSRPLREIVPSDGALGPLFDEPVGDASGPGAGFPVRVGIAGMIDGCRDNGIALQ